MPLTYETVIKTIDEASEIYHKAQRAAKAAADQFDKTRAAAAKPIRAGARAVFGSGGQSGSGRSSGPSGSSPLDSLGNMIGSGVKEFDSGIPILQDLLGILKVIGFAAAGAGASIFGLGVIAAHVAAEHEALRLALVAVSGSAEEADRQLRRLREVARLPGLGFAEAVQGSARLQAVGFDSRLAERALMSFGNALALVGGGKDELDGVILALSQIAAKGKVSAEEINQLAERVPQIRAAMIAAFGTADTEALQKMNIDAARFIPAIIAELAKLPKAGASAKNAFENFADSVQNSLAAIGRVVNSVFAPAINKLGDFLNFASESGLFAEVARRFMSSGEQMLRTAGAAGDAGLATVQGAATPNRLHGDRMTKPISDAVYAGAGEGRTAIDFVAQAKDAGDALVRAASLLISGFTLLPELAQTVFKLAEIGFDKLKLIVEDITQKVVAFLDKMRDIKFRIGGIDLPIGFKIGGDLRGVLGGPENPEIKKKREENDRREKIERAMLDKLGGRWTDFAKDIYRGFGEYKPSNEVENDRSLGSLNSASERTAKATEELLALEKRQAAINDRILGGGGKTDEALSMINLDRYNRGGRQTSGGGGNEIERTLRRLVNLLAAQATGSVVSARRLNWDH